MSVKTCQYCPYSAHSSSNIDRHVVSVHFKKGKGQNHEIAIVQETSPSLSKIAKKKKKPNHQRSEGDLQNERIDLFEKLSSWMEESQRQLAEVIGSFDIDTDNNRGTAAVLVEEVCDLKARLSIMTKERNRLLFTVKKMSDEIGILRASLQETNHLGTGYSQRSLAEEASHYTRGFSEGNGGFGEHSNANAELTGDHFSSSVRWSRLDKSKEFVAFFKLNITEEVEGYRCTPCGSGNLFKSKFGMYVHVRDKHIMAGTKYKCPSPHCKTITGSENKMKYHVEKKHPKLKGMIDVVGCLFPGDKGGMDFDNGQQVTVEVNEKPHYEMNPGPQFQMGDEDGQYEQSDQMDIDADDDILDNATIKVEVDSDEGLVGYSLCTTDMDNPLDKTENAVKQPPPPPPPATNRGAEAKNNYPTTMSSAPSDKSKEVAAFFRENIVAEAGGHRCKPCGSGKLYKSRGLIDSHVKDKHIMGLIKFKCPSPQCPNPHMWVKSENGIKYHIYKQHPELKGKVNLEECIVYRNVNRSKGEENMGQKHSVSKSDKPPASKLTQSEEVSIFYRDHVVKKEGGYQCMVCGEAWLFQSKVGMNFHVKNMHVIPGIRYKCPASSCLTISIDEKALRGHISMKHPNGLKKLNVQQCMVRSMKGLSN